MMDSDELQLLCKEMGQELRPEDEDAVMAKLDVNGDGRIPFEEFLTWWQLGLSPAALLDDAVASGLREKINEGEASVKRERSKSLSETASALLSKKQQEQNDAERRESRGTYHLPRQKTMELLKDRPEREPTSYAGVMLTRDEAAGTLRLSMPQKIIEAAREHYPELLSGEQPSSPPTGYVEQQI